MRGTDSAVFMLLWFAALPAIVGLAGGLCFCCCRRRCCWRCHGGSFSFCGVDALMVWCFASQCWTCWRLVFLLLSSSWSVGDVIVRVSDSAVFMLLWFAACHYWTCRRLVFLLLSSSLLLEMSWWELQFLRC